MKHGEPPELEAGHRFWYLPGNANSWPLVTESSFVVRPPEAVRREPLLTGAEFVRRRYQLMSGTSMAAPHVAGLAALTIQAAASLGADLGARRAFAVKVILRAACTRLPRLRRTEQG